MAGGKATRFNTPVEKGLLKVGGVTLLERSLNALRAGELSRVFVATSPHTPRTALMAVEIGVEVIETSGEGYHQDILELLDAHSPFLTLNVDIPFVRKEHVTTVLEAFDGRSLAAILPIRSDDHCTKSELIVESDGDGQSVWVGLNVVTPDPETLTVELNDPLLAVNINDEADLAMADSVAREKRL